jgi:hypothetical protein
VRFRKRPRGETTSLKEAVMGKHTLWKGVSLISLTFLLIFCGRNSMAAEPYVVGYVADITGMARANYAPEAEGCRLYIL